MELEIKHLAPYLPYGLTFLIESKHDSKEPNINELKSIDIGLKMVNFGWGNAKYFTEIRPILKNKIHLYNLQIEILNKWGDGLSDKAKGYWLKEMIENMINSTYDSLRFDEVEFMLENHIDVFGLIDKGLAIKI
jgi:hypothetical protein